jgi:hypothetical protein
MKNLKLYTPEQATRLSRELLPELDRLVALRRLMREVATRLDVLTLTLAGATAGNPDADEARRLLDTRREIDERISAGIARIHEHGVLIKDLDQGLIDFYSLAGDRLIFLCWKLGEPEVAHWHPISGGYADRQPLNPSPLED